MTTPVTIHNAAHNVDVEKSTLVNNGNGVHHHDGFSSGPVNRAITPGGHPLDTSQPAFPVFHRRIGNPAPLGLLSFASTTFVLSFYNVGIRNIATPNVIVGMAIGFGGLAQIIAGIFEFVSGNTFGATAFTSYGGFWLSFAAIYWPSSGILTAYTNKQELASALGIYLITWFIFTFLLMLGTLRSSVGLFLVFFFLTLTFLMLAIGEFESGNVGASCHKAGGALGIITAFIAFYTGASGLYTSDTTYFKLPTYDLSGSAKTKAQ